MAVFDYFGPLLLTALVFIPLEQVVPLCREQRLFREGWRLDAIRMIVNGFWIRIGFALIALFVTHGVTGLMPPSIRRFVGDSSFWIQLPAAIVLADLCFYGVHRAFHQVPFLWRFHAVHHSIETLDWLAGHRVHPIDQICTKGSALVPLIALGFSNEALAAYGFIYAWHSVLFHANTRIDIGPLAWVIASPRFHHWHHADQAEAIESYRESERPNSLNQATAA
jgi:sterol desaturase/sphingolipid hydroxylase (fatty acid hydroxylase superfamily)